MRTIPEAPTERNVSKSLVPERGCTPISRRRSRTLERRGTKHLRRGVPTQRSSPKPGQMTGEKQAIQNARPLADSIEHIPHGLALASIAWEIRHTLGSHLQKELIHLQSRADQLPNIAVRPGRDPQPIERPGDPPPLRSPPLIPLLRHARIPVLPGRSIQGSLKVGPFKVAMYILRLSLFATIQTTSIRSHTHNRLSPMGHMTRRIQGEPLPVGQTAYDRQPMPRPGPALSVMIDPHPT